MTNQLTVKDVIKKSEGNFKKLLDATGTDVNRFMNNAIIASSENPDIASGNVSTKSVINVCSRAANDGVVLDGKEAAIVIGWSSQSKSKEAQYRLMAGGVMKMINRSPNIKRVIVQLVHENDECVIDLVADGVPVQHSINLKAERGEIIGAYAVAELADGNYTSPEYMTTEQINTIRDEYTSGKSPMWIKSWGEAARKTVLHRAKKRWPIASDVENALRDDEKGDDIVVIENEPEPAKKPRKKASVKDAVKEKMVEQVTAHDAETGEVVEAEFEEVAELPQDDEPEMPI